jgi:hypothetical protein
LSRATITYKPNGIGNTTISMLNARDPMLIQGWFKCIQDIKIQYGTLDEDSWNFDETGFQMGVIATVRVVTGTNKAGQPRTIQLGKREWVTIIECINVMGMQFNH